MKARNFYIPITLMLALAAGTLAKAQDRALELKNSMLNFGIGFGWVSNFYADNSQWPIFSVSYEKALIEYKKVGIFGLGAIGGYQHAYYAYPSSGDFAKWQNTVAALRATWHPTILMTQHFDCYLGILAGARYEFFKDTRYDYNPAEFKNNPYKQYGGFHSLFAGFAGMRIQPGERLGFFVEAGYGMSYVTVGLNWKFGERNIKADPNISKRGIRRPR